MAKKQQTKQKLPKGWRKELNAVPLPFSRPWPDAKQYTDSVGIVGSIGNVIEEVGLDYLLAHLECVCDEQASLYGDGCKPVFPKDEHLAGIWAFFAKRFRDMHKFTRIYNYEPGKRPNFL